MSVDTGKAKLPALPPVTVDDAGLQRWIQSVTERLEVREGSRGNLYERSVTVRDLETALRNLTAEGDTVVQSNGDLKIKIGGMNATISVQQFADAIRQTRLYRDLLTRLDDPNRFNTFPSEIRNILLKSIAEEAAQRGADIQRLETKIQDANRSVAIKVEEVTAALGVNQAGIREVQAAYVNSTQATATQVTQLESSLGNYYQDGTPGRALLEEELTTQVSFVDGLRSQYTLKVQAGGALAGFGVAAEEVNGVPSSAFLISADKFAIVAPNYSGGLTTSPNLNNIPFGVDASGVYINGQVRINATGLELQQVSRSLSLTAPTNVFKQDSSGSWDGTSITITANKLGGLTAIPAWSVLSGSYGGSLPSGNALSVSRTSMNTDVVVFSATATQDGFNYSDDFTIARLSDGSNAITAILSNDAHSVSADASGNVISYTGSGTQIRVYEGAAELSYNGSGTSNGTWTVSAAGSGITPGSITDSGLFATVNSHANFLTAANTATITYSISGRTAGGSSFSVTKIQSFSKSRTGAQGPQGSDGAGGADGADGSDGADGADGSRGSMTFYATGGVWSDTTANNIVTSVTGSATRIIGDTVTISNGSTFAETRYWSGINWVAPGVVIDGNLLVNGTISGDKIGANQVTADKIDSRNLTVKDGAGNIIFGAGNNLDWGRISNQPGGIYNSSITIGANGVLTGAGGGQVSLSGLGAGNFAFLNQINSGNIGTYISTAAIGGAYIQNAAISNALIADAAISNAKIGDAQITTAKIGAAQIDTLRVAGNAITSQGSASRTNGGSVSFVLNSTTGGQVLVIAEVDEASGRDNCSIAVYLNGGLLGSFSGAVTYDSNEYPYQASAVKMFLVNVGVGGNTISAVSNYTGCIITGLLTQR